MSGAYPACRTWPGLSHMPWQAGTRAVLAALALVEVTARRSTQRKAEDHEGPRRTTETGRNSASRGAHRCFLPGPPWSSIDLVVEPFLSTNSLRANGVRIVSVSRTNENAPSHRIYIDQVEVGAAWSKRSNEGRDYLSVKLDDPSFNAPIYANLFNDEGGETFSLVWSRPAKRD